MATYQVVHYNPAGTGTTAHMARVERGLSATGPWTVIGQMGLINDLPGPNGPEGYFYDNTVPFDTAVWYRITEILPDGTNGNSSVLGPFTLVGNGNVVLSDPLRPWADIEFDFCDTAESLNAAVCNPSGEFIWTRFGPRVRAADAGLFNILNAERPADVYARRKDHTGALRFLTKSLAAIDQVYDLFTAGGPLYLRAPDVYGRTDFFLQPGDLPEEYLSELVDQRWPHRTWEVPYVVVDGPLGPQQGTDCANWCAVKATFPTFAALTGTWGDLASGVTICP
ncbi:hypothetical protein AB0F16_41260 [Streptomyces tanashiensis]|uniref:hypothetical protein n=1 Tax=Streptomyces tanashiensis TaxID=67367 RepID=UPI0033E82CA9